MAPHAPGPVPATVKLRPSHGAQAAPMPPTAPLSVPSIYPQPVVFAKTDFTFNRRFFETKLAGFFRLIPGDAEKDMVLYIQAMRGQFVGKRITKISPTDLHLLIFRSAASAEEVIPLIEIQEVQIRHQDTV